MIRIAVSLVCALLAFPGTARAQDDLGLDPQIDREIDRVLAEWKSLDTGEDDALARIRRMQDERDARSKWYRPTSERERKYAETLAKTLGLPLLGVKSFAGVTNSAGGLVGEGESRRFEVRGVLVELEGLDVCRNRFRGAAKALDYAAVNDDVYGTEEFGDEGEERWIEVRGKQTVVLAGPNTSAKAMAAAWSVLRGAGTLTFSARVRGPNEFTATSHVATGLFFRHAKKALELSLKTQNHPGLEVLGPNSIKLTTGDVIAELRVDSQGAWGRFSLRKVVAAKKNQVEPKGYEDALERPVVTVPRIEPKANGQGAAGRLDNR